MRETVTFRQAVESDIPQLIDLMNSQYSRKKYGSYFLWQYFSSIYPTILMCAFLDSQLIGMFGLQKRILESGAYVGQAIDLLVASEWRGKGIFKLLGEKATGYFQDIDLFCVLPNQYGKNACEKAFGWRTLCKMNSMCLHKEHYMNLSKKTSKDPPPNSKEQIFDKFHYSNDIRCWRFDKNPDYKYTHVMLTTGEFIITKVFKDPVTGVRFGDIVDFECNLNNQEPLKELFLKAVMRLKEQDVESITTWALPHSPLREVVESLGFTELSQERYFCLKILNKTYAYLNNIEHWHLVQSDAEIY